MQNWLNFWIFLFWVLLLSFVFNATNFVFLLIYSEITWVILFIYSILTGSFVDDLNLFTLSFFILGFASVEFCFGFLLIILFKNLNKILNFIDEENIWYVYLYKHSKKFVKIKKDWNVIF